MRDSIVCEIRCPIHGFIGLNEFEKRIVDHPIFQRLRRIRQLAWTDHVYPAAMHTRFEHSLGVMHVATMLYDSIVGSSSQLLQSTFGYTEAGLIRDRQKVRLAGLLHDVGHSPFSHGSEELYPEKPVIEARAGTSVSKKPEVKHFRHEDYSFAMIRGPLKEAIEADDWNRRNYGITAEDIAAIIEGNPSAGPALFWRDLLSGQLDADRMDYLLRDSHHTGVTYGKFDLHRIVATIRAFEDQRRGEKTPRIGISSGGWHAAEALIIARYYMHKQVYFHKTRAAYDIHLKGAMTELLPSGKYPKPDPEGLGEYIKWDDWKVLGLLASGQGGEHGQRLLTRNHFRLVYQSKANRADIDALIAAQDELKRVKEALGGLLIATKTYPNNWYKLSTVDIPVVDDHDNEDVRPLSEYSALLRGFAAQDQELLFVKPEQAAEAKSIVEEVVKSNHNPQLKMEFEAPKRKEVASAS
jgi:uncharacterized protein